MERNSLQTQLAPGWSGVNIALMAVLFYVWWPLGLLMIAYIVWGAQFGLNLARPETFKTASQRMTSGSRAPGATQGGGTPSGNTAQGTPDNERSDFDRWRQQETERLRSERETLERDRAEFEASRRDGRD